MKELENPRRAYTKPPLEEVICVFKFDDSGEWDWTVPGLIYNSIKDEYPEKIERQSINVTVRIKPSVEAENTAVNLAMMQFLREDRTGLVQVGPNMLTFNSLKRYPGWISYKDKAMELLDIYTNVKKSANLVDVRLRYVNQVRIPSMDFMPEEYLELWMKLPDRSHDSYSYVSGFLIKSTLSYENPKMALDFLLRPQPRGDADSGFTVLFDLSIRNVDESFTESRIEDWLEIAHSRLSIFFDSAFTEKAHCELFEEIKK